MQECSGIGQIKQKGNNLKYKCNSELASTSILIYFRIWLHLVSKGRQKKKGRKEKEKETKENKIRIKLKHIKRNSELDWRHFLFDSEFGCI